MRRREASCVRIAVNLGEKIVLGCGVALATPSFFYSGPCFSAITLPNLASRRKRMTKEEAVEHRLASDISIFVIDLCHLNKATQAARHSHHVIGRSDRTLQRTLTASMKVASADDRRRSGMSASVGCTLRGRQPGGAFAAITSSALIFRRWSFRRSGPACL